MTELGGGPGVGQGARGVLTAQRPIADVMSVRRGADLIPEGELKE